MESIFIIRSEKGDEYKLKITSENTVMISDDVQMMLCDEGIEILDIDLNRSEGLHFTDLRVLSQIEECIAEVFFQHPNAIICFFCDFISLVPSMKRHISVQEYRSRLFSGMFTRYVSHHNIDNVKNRVVIVKGVAEDYFVHVIARQQHMHYVDIICQGIQTDFGK